MPLPSPAHRLRHLRIARMARALNAPHGPDALDDELGRFRAYRASGIDAAIARPLDAAAQARAAQDRAEMDFRFRHRCAIASETSCTTQRRALQRLVDEMSDGFAAMDRAFYDAEELLAQMAGTRAPQS